MYVILLLPLLLFTYLSNNHISVSTHQLTRPKQKNNRSVLSIVQISDLHNKSFGFGQSRLIKQIAALRPDLIAVTGDVVDGAPYRNALTFLKEASRICPVYFVRGNHESIAGNFPVLERELTDCDIHLLKNTGEDFQKDGYIYRISGLDDPAFKKKKKTYASYMKRTLDRMMRQQKSSRADYRILLSHRPELFPLYSRYPFDLVLCGHAHGGQFRPPFTDGLYAPNQGIFPKYTSGAHTKNHTTEIISRGLGNSSFPLRLLNCPEIVHILIQ